MKPSLSCALVVISGFVLVGCGNTPDTDVPAVDPPAEAGPAGFSHAPAGVLEEGSGTGRQDEYVYAPDIRFPMEQAHAYLNSQVWGVGGSNGDPGSQCAQANYSYPWKDNYCESRSWDMPLCPAGQGHQGVDIRPASCDKDTHWAVAAEDGRITQIGTYTVYLRGAESGTVYRYMHLNMDRLADGIVFGADVKQGQKIGLVSDYFGGASTTLHLHFDMKQTVKLPNGESVQAYVPPYTSLIEAYKALQSQ